MAGKRSDCEIFRPPLPARSQRGSGGESGREWGRESGRESGREWGRGVRCACAALAGTGRFRPEPPFIRRHGAADEAMLAGWGVVQPI